MTKQRTSPILKSVNSRSELLSASQALRSFVQVRRSPTSHLSVVADSWPIFRLIDSSSVQMNECCNSEAHSVTLYESFSTALLVSPRALARLNVVRVPTDWIASDKRVPVERGISMKGLNELC